MGGKFRAIFHRAGGKEPFGKLISARQTVQQTAAKRRIVLPAEGRDPRHPFGSDRQVMGLLVIHHLDAVLQLAVLGIKRGKVRGDGLRQPVFRGQGGKPAQGGTVAQGQIAPARDQLPGLGEEFDLADTALTEFHVMPLDRHGTVQATMLADAQAHVMGILNRREIEMFAPDKRRQRL